MALTIDYVSDWQTRLRGRIYWQFKGKPKIQAWVDMVARQFSDIEDALQTLLTLPSIDDSAGAQLDLLGRLLGQARGGVDDDTYRTYLFATRFANKSSGTAEDIYRVFAALFASPMLILSSPVKSFRLTLWNILTPDQAAVGLRFLRKVKEAGARAILEFTTISDDNIMRWDVEGHGWDVSTFGSATQA